MSLLDDYKKHVERPRQEQDALEIYSLREQLSELRADNDAMAARIQAGDRARDDVIEECALVLDGHHQFFYGSIVRRLKTKPLS